MNVQEIPIITVCYNTPDLIENLISQLRNYYSNIIYIIDGSDEKYAKSIADIAKKYSNVNLTHFNYNIHHGPGMKWAFQNLGLSGRVLVLDSDVHIIRGGFVEKLAAILQPHMYGVGCLNWVNREGFNIDYRDGAIRYLHPAVMLCNMDVVQQWPMPTKHGAPMVETMVALHDAGRSDLLGHAEWLENDFSNSDNKNYLIHDSRGTVFRVGTYNLDEWQASVMEDRVKAEGYNKELLAMIPKDARGIVEVGCNNGSLACAYKLINPQCIYTGIEINSMAAESARRHCDSVLAMDIEKAEEGFFRECMSRSNVWVFGDVLEHLVDPWSLLGKIRRTLPADGCVVISLPNAQHWSVQGKLSCGFLRYEEHGLLDRTHLRFFTRITMLELLHGAGFRVDQGVTRNFGGINSSNVIAAIKLMAASFGADPEMALADSLPLQYVVRAVPA